MGIAAPLLGLATTAFGVGSKVLSGIAGYNSETAALQYQAEVAQNNARLAKYNANIAEQQGEAQSTAAGLAGRAKYGALLASEGASGVDVSSPSFVGARDTQARFNQLDAMTIKSNYARQVYGYRLQQREFKSEAQMAEDAEPTPLQKILGIVGTVLGGGSQGAQQYQGYTQSGALPDFFGNNSLDTSAVAGGAASAMTPMDLGGAVGAAGGAGLAGIGSGGVGLADIPMVF